MCVKGVVKMLSDIYQRLGDEKSRQIYKSRLLYSLTDDYDEIIKVIGTTKQALAIKEFTKSIDDGSCIIWGAGYWGTMIKRSFPDVKWKCYFDNQIKEEVKEGLQVFHASQFLHNYKNEYIVIAVMFYEDQIEAQLVFYGVEKSKIIKLSTYIKELEQQQYFDLEELTHDDDEVFVDVGCFDGMTVKTFLKWCEYRYKEIVSFEPDQTCYEKCKAILANVSQYTLINKGLWNEEDTLSFLATGDSNSKVLNNGGSKINVCRLDEVINDRKVTFIKMDIEGAEKKALMGAERIIRNQKPKLAISIYHKKEDIWELPQIIMSMNPQYKLYLRHYSFRDAETVLYAV